MGEKKKSKPLIFCPLKTRRENAPKTQTNSDTPFRPQLPGLAHPFFRKN